MTDKTIQIKCRGAETLSMQGLQPFQGELKSLSEVDFQKLRKKIVEKGFRFPFHIWNSPGGKKLIDGHQRLRVLTKLKEEGYSIPDLPVDIIEADSEKEAKELLLDCVAEFGKVEGQGLYEYMVDAEMDLSILDNLRIPDLDLVSFANEFFENPTERITPEYLDEISNDMKSLLSAPEELEGDFKDELLRRQRVLEAKTQNSFQGRLLVWGSIISTLQGQNDEDIISRS